MGFKEKLEAAGYELIAPEKQELFSESNKLQKKSIKNNPIDLAIISLNNKINQSRTGKERYILEKQIEQLIKLQKLYKEYIKTNITNNTKKQINEIFSSIKDQINFKNNNNLSNDYKIIESKLKKEKQQLKDTIDFFSYGTIRDLVENNIDINGIRESISPQKYQDFFDMVTIEYINILEKIQKEKYNYKIILKQKGFLLTKQQLQNFIFIIANKTKYNFNFSINTIENNKTKKYTIDLKLFKKENYEEIQKNKKQQNIITTSNNKTKIEDIKNKNIIPYNYDKLATNEKMQVIEKLLNKPQNQKFLLAVINKLNGKTITINRKKIKINDIFIEKHKNKLLNNLKTLILLIIEIESDGKRNAKNTEGSSGKGIGQWLNGNGGEATEFMYRKKWYTKRQLNNIGINKYKLKIKRTVWHTSSFQTTLKKIYLHYAQNILKQLNFIPKKYNKYTKISPLNLNLEQQIQLLILDIGINGKTVKNGLGQKVGIKDFMGTALLGNSWALKEIYKIFHHTKPDKKTLNRIKKISPKYFEKLESVIKINN